MQAKETGKDTKWNCCGHRWQWLVELPVTAQRANSSHNRPQSILW